MDRSLNVHVSIYSDKILNGNLKFSFVVMLRKAVYLLEAIKLKISDPVRIQT
jgi:hypothetical protein